MSISFSSLLIWLLFNYQLFFIRVWKFQTMYHAFLLMSFSVWFWSHGLRVLSISAKSSWNLLTSNRFSKDIDLIRFYLTPNLLLCYVSERWNLCSWSRTGLVKYALDLALSLPLFCFKRSRATTYKQRSSDPHFGTIAHASV